MIESVMALSSMLYYPERKNSYRELRKNSAHWPKHYFFVEN